MTAPPLAVRTIGELAPNPLARAVRLGAAAGVLGLAVAVGGLLAGAEPPRFFRAYLVGFMFCLGLSLGSMALVMIHHLTGGAWGMVVRRPLEAAARTLPVVTLFFVPIAAAGLAALYPWARPETVAADPLLQAKQPYLNVPFFLARAALYFAAWNALVWTLARWSRAQDEGGPQALGTERKFRLLSAPGLLAYGLFITFASIDWVMSLDPHWYSTIFGVIFMGGQGLAAMALAILLLAWLQAYEPYRSTVTPGHFHDLGTLLFAFVMLWAYFGFSQFLIIWSGDLPEEITWYIDRLRGGWGAVALGLAVGQFIVPFLLLLSRDLKRNPRALAAVALAVLAMRYVDLLWLIVPGGGVTSLHWLDVVVPASLAALWVAALAAQLRRTMPLPVNDPYYAEYMSDVAAH